MAHLPPYPDTRADSAGPPENTSAAGPPRWAAVLGISVALGLLLLLVVLHATGAMGPGAH